MSCLVYEYNTSSQKRSPNRTEIKIIAIKAKKVEPHEHLESLRHNK